MPDTTPTTALTTTPTSPEEALRRAVTTAPRAHYTDHPRLGTVPQRTAQFAIERDLLRARITPGMRVLEIGTGTGYTGALLAELAGPTGYVVSVDIDPFLVDRARVLHAERRVENLTVVCGDGLLGALEQGPYDAILGWATPTHIPDPWLAQSRPGAIISTPIYLAPVARTVGHIRGTVHDDGTRRGLTDVVLGEAVYVDMAPQINQHLGIPMVYLDARHDTDGDVAWVSVAWRDRVPGHDPNATVRMLMNPGHVETVDLADTDETRALAWRDFRAYCAARDSQLPFSSLTTYGTAGETWTSGVGFSSGNNAAILTADGELRANRPGSPALTKLTVYFQDWNIADRPGLARLHAALTRCGTGWQAAVTTAYPTELDSQ